MLNNRQNVVLAWFSIVLMALLGACGQPSGPSDQGAPMPVRVMSPVLETVELWDDYIGRFTAVERVELRPRVSGYLEAVHFDDGAIVEQGQLLFTVDQRPFQAALERAEAEFEAVRTQRSLSEAELDRAEELLEARAGSREEYDQALQARDASLANLRASEAAVRQAALELEFTEIRAPISGRIGQDLINVGNLVSAEQTLLTTIVSIDPIYFEFNGTEQDYLRYIELDRDGNRKSSRLEPNPVRVRIASQDDYAIEGVMDFVNNEIDARSGTILGRARFANPEGFLTPGLFGELRLYGRDPYEAILIPDEAVQFDQSRQFVWMISEDGQATMRVVELGRLLDDGRRIVEGGLTADDQVIVGGLAILRPGLPVQALSSAPAPGQGGPSRPAQE
ncbi:MAG: efflux RND transporter periplasmic adaptor subunit [Pseudomonadota bacterium]